MSTLRTRRDVGTDEVVRTLTDVLGPQYRVTATSNTTLKVGRTGVIPSKVQVIRCDGITVFKVTTTGFVVSRIIQAMSINPRVRRALETAYPNESA